MWDRFNAIYTDYPSLSLFSFKAVLDTFGPDFQKDVRSADWLHIEAIFARHFHYNKFPDVFAINEFVSKGARMGLDKKLYAKTQKEALTPEYKRFLALDWNLLRNRERYPRDDQPFNQWHTWFEDEKTKEILDVFNHKTIKGYKQTFSFIDECTALQVWDFYNVSNASQILFNAAIKKGIKVLDLMAYLIHLPQFNRIFSFDRLMNYIRELAPLCIIPLGKLLNNADYPNKQYVLLAYYNSLEDAYIDKKMATEYLALLSGFNGRFYLYFNNVNSYIKYDKLFLLNALKVLAGKDYILNDKFFETHAADIRNTGLMEQAYLEMIRKENHYDHDGSELTVILKLRPSFYIRLLEHLVQERHSNRNDQEKLGKVWELPNALTHIEKAVNFLVSQRYLNFHADELLTHLFDNTIKVEDFRANRLTFLIAYIEKNAGNIKRIKSVFKIISGQVQEHFAILLHTYLKANKSFDQFQKIRWNDHGLRLISGDAIAAEIDERAWNRVKEVLEGMQPAADFLQHRVFVNKQIAYCQKSAISERKHNFLRNEY